MIYGLITTGCQETVRERGLKVPRQCLMRRRKPCVLSTENGCEGVLYHLSGVSLFLKIGSDHDVIVSGYWRNCQRVVFELWWKTYIWSLFRFHFFVTRLWLLNCYWLCKVFHFRFCDDIWDLTFYKCELWCKKNENKVNFSRADLWTIIFCPFEFC